MKKVTSLLYFPWGILQSTCSFGMSIPSPPYPSAMPETGETATELPESAKEAWQETIPLTQQWTI